MRRIPTMWFILGAVTGAGSSAEHEFRVRRRARLRTRALALFVAMAAGAAGVWALRTGRADVAVALWAVAGAAAALQAWSGFGGRDVQRWRRGAEGERRTAVVLGGLSARRWSVRHDLRIPGSRANIDHVVIGRTGVWVVDSKATRAPVRARWRRVYFGDRRLETDSVRWEAEIVSERLARALGGPAAGWSGQRSGGRPGGEGHGAACRPRGCRPDDVAAAVRPGDVAAAVRPLVVVHGEGLRRRGARAGGVPVVRADRLVARIRTGRRRLRGHEIQAAVEALDRAFPGTPTGPRSHGGWLGPGRPAGTAEPAGTRRAARAGRAHG